MGDGLAMLRDLVRRGLYGFNLGGCLGRQFLQQDPDSMANSATTAGATAWPIHFAGASSKHQLQAIAPGS